MLKSLKTLMFSLAVFAFCGTNANAAFNILVQSTGGPGFLTYNSSATSNFLDLFDNIPFNGNDLIMSYSVTNNAPATGSFVLNNLSFVYQGPAVPESLQVLITENNANFYGNGANLAGFASFSANGNVQSTFSNSSTFVPGSGANFVNFPPQNFTGLPTVYNGSTFFTSGGSTGTVSTLFDITITPNSNVNFAAGGGFGSIGVSDFAVPAPPALLLGLMAIPTLATLRRRMFK